jgi:hypothetical protein
MPVARKYVLAALAMAALVPAVCFPASAVSADGKGGSGGQETFPQGDLFEPLIADPKQQYSYLSLHTFEMEDGESFTAGAVGYSADFGLARWGGGNWQSSVQGGLFAQFNMETESHDLLNADYTFGLALTHRNGRRSERFRLYHQSSHLGDELLINNRQFLSNRVNFSYEALEALVSYEWSGLRLYGGGQYVLHRVPASYDRAMLQTGAEFYLGEGSWDLPGRYIAGLDIKGYEEQHWDPSLSVKAGIERGHKGSGNRRVRLLLEYYRGHMPYGQFYDQRMTSYGAGLYVAF